MAGTLILVRHGESLWNALNVWTGLTDIGLSDKGKAEAVRTAQRIAQTPPNRAFTSALSRAQETLQIILDTIHAAGIPITKSASLNERDYGEYTGKNKQEVRGLLGDDGYLALRRGWDVPVPNGESLKQVYGRVVPYFIDQIFPWVKSGETVLVVAHGNSLRALMKYLEHVSDENIAHVELKTGEPVWYESDATGNITRIFISSDNR